MPATCSDCGRSGRRIPRLGWCDLSLSGGVGQAATVSGVRCLRSDSLLSWSDRTSTRVARSESDEPEKPWFRGIGYAIARTMDHRGGPPRALALAPDPHPPCSTSPSRQAGGQSRLAWGIEAVDIIPKVNRA